MTKFIKLTNDADNHKGNTLYINAEHITAVYEAPGNSGGIKTFIFGGFTGVQWEVEESPKKILDLISPLQFID